MTPREAFETVANHLLAQGRPSKNEKGMCVYRGPDGLKCAVGALIPDKAYNPRMEDICASSIIVRFDDLEFLKEANLEVNGERLLDVLQLLHDSPYFWKSPKRKLKRVGQVFNLSTDFLDALED